MGNYVFQSIYTFENDLIMRDCDRTKANTGNYCFSRVRLGRFFKVEKIDYSDGIERYTYVKSDNPSKDIVE